MIASSTLIRHFLEFFFAPTGAPWYDGAVWGNVIAVLPLAVLGAVGFWWHHRVLSRAHARIDALVAAHDRHAVRLKALLDAVDPEVEGGISGEVAAIRDLLDLHTPGGLAEIAARLDRLKV